MAARSDVGESPNSEMRGGGLSRQALPSSSPASLLPKEGKSVSDKPHEWPRFLRGERPQEILEHLSEGDPLRLRERTARRLREVWILLDPDRAYYRALAVCADAVPYEDPPPDLAEWVLGKIDL